MISFCICKKKTVSLIFGGSLEIFERVCDKRENEVWSQDFCFYKNILVTQDPIINQKVLKNSGKSIQSIAPTPYINKRISTRTKHFQNNTNIEGR